MIEDIFQVNGNAVYLTLIKDTEPFPFGIVHKGTYYAVLVGQKVQSLLPRTDGKIGFGLILHEMAKNKIKIGDTIKLI